MRRAPGSALQTRRPSSAAVAAGSTRPRTGRALSGRGRWRSTNQIPVRARLIVAAAALAMLASGCGGGGEDAARRAWRRGRRPPEQRLRARAAQARRAAQSDPPGAAARSRRSALRDREARRSPGARGRPPAADEPFLSTCAATCGHGGPSRVLVSIAFPPAYRQSRRFYVAYTDDSGAICGSRSSARGARTRRRARRGTRRERDRDQAAVERDPQRRAAARSARTGGLYIGAGDGGTELTTPTTSASDASRCSASCSGSTRARAANSRTGAGLENRSSAPPPAVTRSHRTASAIRSASRSIARRGADDRRRGPGRWSRRSTTRRRGGRRGGNSAGGV